MPIVHAGMLCQQEVGRVLGAKAVAKGPAVRPVGLPARAAGGPRLGELVLGRRNALVIEAVREVCRAPGRALNPLVVHGPAGVGKSHLLAGLAAELRAAGLERVERLGAAEFARSVRRAIRTGATAALRVRLRGAAALLLDDVQRLSTSPAAQVELIHTFDALFHAGRQIVVAASHNPRHVPELHPGLRGRLLMGLCVALEPPGPGARRRILEQRARAAGLQLSERLLDELVEALGGSGRQLVEAVERLRGLGAGARLQQLAEVRSLLADLIAPAAGCDARPELRVLEEVAAACGVSVDAVLGAGRSRPVALARQLGMYLVRRLAGLSLVETSRLFRRASSTILLAERRIERRLAVDPYVRALLERCRGGLGSPAGAPTSG
ncbi:MAG: hypothetical protein KatS3mg102_1133 [Planctomycetota bacterium]|nr:MAG: hypothetical protein KatS3mg102_1133 [Planctomycetota bacterium]